MNDEDSKDDKRPVITLGEASDRKLADLLGSLLDTSAQGVGASLSHLWEGLFGQRIAQWRYINSIELARNFAKKCEERGINPNNIRQMPMSEIYSVLENGSKVEDQTLRDAWAGLWAQAADPGSGVKAEAHYTELLKQLGPVEAASLEAFRVRESLQARHQSEVRALRESPFNKDKFEAARGSLDDDISRTMTKLFGEISVDRLTDSMTVLLRLKLIESSLNYRIPRVDFRGVRLDRKETRELAEFSEKLNQNIMFMPSPYYIHAQKKNLPLLEILELIFKAYKLTAFGKRFVAACQ